MDKYDILLGISIGIPCFLSVLGFLWLNTAIVQNDYLMEFVGFITMFVGIAGIMWWVNK